MKPKLDLRLSSADSGTRIRPIERVWKWGQELSKPTKEYNFYQPLEFLTPFPNRLLAPFWLLLAVSSTSLDAGEIDSDTSSPVQLVVAQVSDFATSVAPENAKASPLNPSLPAGTNSTGLNSLSTPNSGGLTTNNPFSQLTRLASLQRSQPQMFADSPSATIKLSAKLDNQFETVTDVPVGGGARRLRVASNNRALPQNRFFFEHQTYFDAYVFDPGNSIDGAGSIARDLHQYTVGFEKTFLGGYASIDVRMPFANSILLDEDDLFIESGTFGNLNTKLKYALFLAESYCLSIGLGIEAPTGSGLDLEIETIPYRFENDAVFLQPFIAYEERFGSWFLNFFSAIDTPLNGNEFATLLNGRTPLGFINDQVLGINSIAVGRWLHFDPNGSTLRGMAAVAELHYTTTLQDADLLIVDPQLTFVTPPTVVNTANRNDHLNMTIGSQFLFNSSALRVGYVQPLRTGDDRLFDYEVNVQLNRYY